MKVTSTTVRISREKIEKLVGMWNKNKFFAKPYPDTKNTLEKLNYTMPYYKPVYRMQEQLHNHFIKIYNESHIKLGNHTEIIFMLKISGIWSSEQSKTYGITFRFYII